MNGSNLILLNKYANFKIQVLLPSFIFFNHQDFAKDLYRFLEESLTFSIELHQGDIYEDSTSAFYVSYVSICPSES